MEVATFKEYVKAYCGGFYSLSFKTMSLRDIRGEQISTILGCASAYLNAVTIGKLKFFLKKKKSCPSEIRAND